MTTETKGKYTAGPWHKSNGFGISACIYADGELVADCQAEGTSPFTCEANAKLIAQAPAMADAIRAMDLVLQGASVFFDLMQEYRDVCGKTELYVRAADRYAELNAQHERMCRVLEAAGS